MLAAMKVWLTLGKTRDYRESPNPIYYVDRVDGWMAIRLYSGKTVQSPRGDFFYILYY